MGPERRDRRRQLPDAGTGDEGGATGQDRQDLRARHPGRFRDAGLSAARLSRSPIVQPGQAGIPGLGPTKTTYNDDIIEGWVGVGSQLDGLGHIGIEHVYYNGNKLADFADAKGLTKLGVEKVPPMVDARRAARHGGALAAPTCEGGTAFNTKEIEEVAKKQGVEIRQGDVVLFHTGWVSLIGKDDKRYNSGEPGLGVDGAKYLVGKGVVAVGADSWGLEVVPFETAERLRGAPDPAADERHLHPGKHEHRAARRRQGLRVHVRARPAALQGRCAEHDQPGRDPVSQSSPVCEIAAGRIVTAMRPASRFRLKNT